MQGKNIIICSDGTGNRGGKGYGTNVWRLYNGVDLKSLNPRQITHYDDGVGTDNNKYLRAFGGAFGWGFSRNVKRAYKFLVRNWDEGDRIYMFGFSRGAYTVRALAAFVSKCGIVKNGAEESEEKLDDAIDRLVDDYHEKRIDDHYSNLELMRDVPIRMVGVWDTVSAIGLPFDILLKKLILNSKVFPFKFQHNRLSKQVEYGMHALAIDDERRTFHPTLWENRNNIEQVWFSGVHSNVGGGYPKQEMSYVALGWMMSKCRWDGNEGIVFDPEFESEVKRNGNVHGRLYDSRSGVAAYYRYAPRDIDYISRINRLEAVKIHQSVFERIQSRTDGYNPGSIPVELPIEVVAGPDSNADAYQRQAENTIRERMDRHAHAVHWINKRKALHLAFVLLTILCVAAFAQFLILRPDASGIEEACDCVVGKGGGWFYPVPVVAGLLVLITMLHLKRYGRKLLCLLALILLGAVTFTSAGKPFLVWDFGERFASGILNFLLPDIAASALVYFIDNYVLHTSAAIAAFLVLLGLRRRYRNKCNKIFEEACNLLRI